MMQMVTAAHGAAGDPNFVRSDFLANLVMADHQHPLPKRILP
jgi:hypothetical protein